MKAFALFYHWNDVKWNSETHKLDKVEPYLVEGCGSDSVFILDARNSLCTMIQDAKDRIRQLAKVKPYVGFTINRGDLRRSKCIHSQLPTCKDIPVVR